MPTYLDFKNPAFLWGANGQMLIILGAMSLLAYKLGAFKK